MPTDEERREIATKLHAIDRENFASCYSEEFEIIEKILGIYEDYDKFIWHVIADLIEPEPERTCMNDSKVGSNSPGWRFNFQCSECGAELCAEEMGNSPLWVDGDAEMISYCPACGAKVVE
ncbi:MAG: hypothetical protein U0M51_04295 [Eggerthellaceae bacterium]